MENCENIFGDESVKQYYEEIAKIPLLTEVEEKELFEEYSKTKDDNIKKRIVNANLRLVTNIAKQYVYRIKGTGMDYLDLVQEGNQGLIKAIEKFDVDQNCKLSTYATFWINQYILSSLNNRAKFIKVSFYLYQHYNKIRKYIFIYREKTGVYPSYSQIAKDLNYTEEFVYKVITTNEIEILSLDDNNGKRFSLHDVLSLDGYNENQKFFSEEIMCLMTEVLNSQEYQVISIRYGFINEYNSNPSEKTLEEISNIMGISRQRINKIEHTALLKLKEHIKKLGAGIDRKGVKKNYIKRKKLLK